MFYYIKGTLVKLEYDYAAVDCSGAAYKLLISKTTYGELTSSLSQTVTLYTYLNVREAVMELYGFFTEEELEMFKMLITVSGIGPKGATSILSVLTPALLINAVRSNDARAISSAPGVGLKSAQKVILELKDKLSKINVTQTSAASQVRGGSIPDAVDALIVLGYSRAQAQNVLKDINASSTEEMIRIALKKLAQ